jgi:hypothetical protein
LQQQMVMRAACQPHLVDMCIWQLFNCKLSCLINWFALATVHDYLLSTLLLLLLLLLWLPASPALAGEWWAPQGRRCVCARSLTCSG